MKVRILEKIYHSTNNPTLSTPFRRQREEYWIKELGCATPYGCNDKIDTVGNLSSPGCNTVNVHNLFNHKTRRDRSHGIRKYNRPNIHDVSFDSLLPLMQEPLGLHHIRTKLFSIPLGSLNILRQNCMKNFSPIQGSPSYRLSAIIMDISNSRLFKPVTIGDDEAPDTRKFIKVHFANKGIDAIKIGNILKHKNVREKIPQYFERKEFETPCISYSYNRSVANKLFNYKPSLKDLDSDSIQNLHCSCSSSKFKYEPCGHIVTGDSTFINNSKLRDLITKGPKFRENKSFTWKENFELVMNAVEVYARSWAKAESADVNSLSEWVKGIRSLVKRRIGHLRNSMSTKYVSIFKDPDVNSELSKLHDKFIFVPADKASNNIVFVCKKYYFQCLIQELGLNSQSGNPTYSSTTFSESEVLDNHTSVLSSFGINVDKDSLELPYIYWIPKLHKKPYKQRFIAGSSRCSTKPLSILLTKLLSTVKDGLQKYCSTAYSRNGVNQMWILKNSKDLINNLHSSDFNNVHSIRSYDFSTLYTTIPHNKLKLRLAEIIRSAFLHKNGNRRYKFLVLHPLGNYFVKDKTDSNTKYNEEAIIRMLNFLIDNIFVVFGGTVFQQTIGIPMGTNCAPLLADLFLYSYEAEFVQKLLSNKQKTLAASFNFTFRYIDDVLSINNRSFHDHLHTIYPPELEIKETTETSTSASYLDLLLSVTDGTLSTKLYDKRDDFDFRIVNFPFICSNIPESPAYGVYISQLIRYARACSSYGDFIDRGRLLTKKLVDQGYTLEKLKIYFRKFYGRYNDLLQHYNTPLSQFLCDLVLC